MTWLELSVRLALRCALHPALAGDLVRVAWRFRARDWNRYFPFMPLPARDYVRWRMYTAYGDPGAVPPVKDVVRYARWSRRAR